MIEVELLEQNPVAGIVIVALAACLFLAVVEMVKLFRASASKEKTVHDVAIEVLAGLWGNDQDRIDRLTAAGYDAEAVRAEVNRIIKSRE